MLKSNLIRLRAVEPEDLDLMYLMENDTEMWQNGSSNVPYSHFALRQFIQQNTNDIYRDGQLRLVVESADGTAVGFLDLQNFDARHLRAEVGIALIPEWQGRGLGTEALRLLQIYVQQHLRLYQLYAYVSMQNEAARHLFRRAGYQETAVLKDWLRAEKGWQDAAFFQLHL